MKLFLSSEGIPRPDLLKKLLPVSLAMPTVAVIHNAQDTYPVDIAKEREDALVALFQSLGFQTLNVDLRTYEGKTDELTKALQTCQLIWCTGGNAFWLRYVMKTSGFDQIIESLLAEGIVYGGWSAGTVVVGPSLRPIELMDDPNVVPEVVWEGLGLVDFFVWPHWDTEKYLPLQAEATARMKEFSYESIVLRDGEALVVENGMHQLVR